MYANPNPTRTGVDRRLLAGLFVALLVAGSLVVLTAHQGRFGFASPSPNAPGNDPTATGRDALTWPFSRDSIWNLPIGANARYVWAGIRHATAMAYFTDADILVMEPSAPLTTVYANYDDWGPGSRCAAQGGALFTAPIPADFVIPGNHQGSEDGDTPNAATAILAADGHTIIQTQPFARCAGQGPTSNYMFGNEDLYGTGETGSHGGSGLSALGGTVRLGELVPGGAIRHSIKLNMDSANFYGGYSGYRWPAWKSDAGGAGYSGSIPEVRIGSLLAAKPDFAISSLESEPGRIVAQAFRDYGAYIVDTSGWSINNFPTEHSPRGSVQQEFQRVWGYSLNAGVGANGWARDLDKIFTNLYVVDNWDHATWQTVSASVGGLGVGGGAPHVAWAPDFGQAPPPTPPPPPPPPPSLTATSLTLKTSKNPSAINETITVSGRLVDASSSGVAGRTVTLEWSADQVTWYPEGQTGQFAPTDANGAFSGPMTFRPSAPRNEYIRARFAGDATYAASSSPVVTQAVVAPPTSPPTDPTLPQVSATVSGTPGANGWYGSPVTITLTATGGNSPTINYQIDNGPWMTYGTPFPIREGRHVVVYQASNANGNHEPPKSAWFEVDSTAPTMSASSGTVVLGSNGTLTWTGSDALSGIAGYEVSVDGGASQLIGSEPRMAGPWSVGSHTAVVKAYDGAGNVATITIAFRVDSAAPSTPAQPAPAPRILENVPLMAALLAAISLILLVAGMHHHRRVQMERAKAKRSRKSGGKGGRKSSTPRPKVVRKVVRRVVRAESDDTVDYSL